MAESAMREPSSHAGPPQPLPCGIGPEALSKTPDPIFALLRLHGLWGAALGAAFVAGVLALDIGSVRALISTSPDGPMALGLLLGFSILTFGSVVMGSAIMMIGSDDEKPRKAPPGLRLIQAAPGLRAAPAMVKAASAKKPPRRA
jgi:hypothetical protein